MKQNARFAKIRHLPSLGRFDAQHEKHEGGCWLWIGYKDKDGYGKFCVNRKHTRAHRFAYETFVGPIAPGLEIDHKCRVRSCVNPAHLEPVSGRENQRRSPISFTTRNRAKTHCPRGHEYSGANTMFVNAKYGKARSCRICKAATRDRWGDLKRGIDRPLSHYLEMSARRLEARAA